jgi:hypothetical protein
MTRVFQIGQTVRAAAVACVVGLVVPTSVNAAWLGYRNDTTVPVIIQSAVVVNNQLRWGKPHTLFPGEVAWDAVPAPGARIIGVFDPKQNNQPVYQEPVTVGLVDIFLSLQMVTPPQIPGRPRQPPQPKFIVTKPPTNPPGGPTSPPTMPRPPGGTGPQPNPKPPANPGTPNNPNPSAPPAPKPPPSNPPGKSG